MSGGAAPLCQRASLPVRRRPILPEDQTSPDGTARHPSQAQGFNAQTMASRILSLDQITGKPKAHGGTRTAKGQTKMGKDKWYKLRGGLSR
jgi:hypothetical protein